MILLHSEIMSNTAKFHHSIMHIFYDIAKYVYLTCF